MKKMLFLTLMQIFAFTVMAQETKISERLTKKWEVGDLKVPESVFFDALTQTIYVSNIVGGHSDKDNTGFISRLSPDGKIITMKWVSGMHAPKGIGVIGNLLYVTDIDRVVEIDIEKGKINRMIEIAGSKFLNDIATDAQGNVYVSDSENSTIHVIRQGKVELLVKSEKLEGINGLYVFENNLLAGVKDKIVSVGIKTKEVDDFILNTGGIDGLVPDGNGNFLISDWTGHVHLVSLSKEKVLLLDTTDSKANAADIDYIASKKLLLVPTFNDNKVVAYELK